MEAFLCQTKRELSDLSSFSRVNIVLGNESCDLDSTISSIVYAYYLSKKDDDPTTSCIPCLNINHEDFPLRTETIYYLKKNNIDLSKLTFRDEIDLHQLYKADKLHLHLVDHNILASQDSELESAVHTVVDHHQNSRDDGQCDVTIELVGSCSTLIAEHLLGEDENWIVENVEEIIAKLLLGTIIFDTVNLSQSAGRVTPKDIRMVEALEQLCPNVKRDELFNELLEAKCDVEGLSTRDLLRKDFKTVTGRGTTVGRESTIGISSITIEMEKLLQRIDVCSEFSSFCKSCNLEILIVMSIVIDSDQNAERWLLVFNHGTSFFSNLVTDLDNQEDLALTLMDDQHVGVVLFHQGDSRVSRKIVLPVLQHFLDRIQYEETNFNNSALVDFTGGVEPSEVILSDLDPFGGSAAPGAKASGATADLFGESSLLSGEEDLGSVNFSFNPFATILDDDPSFRSPSPPMLPTEQPTSVDDLFGIGPVAEAPTDQFEQSTEGIQNSDDPFGLFNGDSFGIQQINQAAFDPFQTISPSSDSFASQEDFIGVPVTADPFNLFSNGTTHSTLSDPFGEISDLFGSPSDPASDAPVTISDDFDGRRKDISQKTDVKLFDNGGFNSFEIVDISECSDVGSQALSALDNLKRVPPTPQNSYSDMSELQKQFQDQEFDHDELFQKVQELDLGVDNNIIVFASNDNLGSSSFWEENGLEKNSTNFNGFEKVKVQSNGPNISDDHHGYHDRNDKVLVSVNPDSSSNQESNIKSSPTGNSVGNITIRNPSCGSEGSASYTDDVSDSSSGDSYSLNEIPHDASHHVITEIQEEDEEEEDESAKNCYTNVIDYRSQEIEEPTVVSNGECEHGSGEDVIGVVSEAMTEKHNSIPMIVIDEVTQRRLSEEVEVPYIVVEEVEDMNFSDDEDEGVVTEGCSPLYSESEETIAETDVRNVERRQECAVEKSSPVLERIDSEAVEDYVGQIVDTAVDTVKMESLVLMGEDSIHHNKDTEFELLDETQVHLKSSPVLERIDSEAVEDYVGQIVDTAVETVKMESPVLMGEDSVHHNKDNEFELLDEMQVHLNSSPVLERIDSEAVEDYVGQIVDTAVDTVKMESPVLMGEDSVHHNKDTEFELLDETQVHLKSSPVLERIDSEAVEDYVEQVVEAAVDTVKMEKKTDEMIKDTETENHGFDYIKSTDQTQDNDLRDVQTNSSPSLERIDSEVVEESVEQMVEAATFSQPPPSQNHDSLPSSSESDKAIVAKEESPSETKKVLELSLDLDIEDSDDNTGRDRSSSAVMLIEEMVAATANQRKEPLKRPTCLQDGILSIDDSIGSPVSALSFETFTPDDEVEFIKMVTEPSSKIVAPCESKPRKPVKLDDDVLQRISFDWNEDSEIMAKAEERQKLKEQKETRTLNKTLSEASFQAKVRMSAVSLTEEWQDDDYSRQSLQGQSKTNPLDDSFFDRTVPSAEASVEDEVDDYASKMEVLDGATLTAEYSLRDRCLTVDSAVLDAAFPVDEEDDEKEDDDVWIKDTRLSPPTSLNVSGARPKHRRKVNIPVGLSIDMDTLDENGMKEPHDPAVLTPSSTEMSWEDETPISSKAATPNVAVEPIPEYTAKEEFTDRRNWRNVSIAGKEHNIDMNVINPYKKVLSHGGYYGDGLNAIIVFASCYMPDKSRRDYSYVMDNLFLYIVSTLELLVAQDYMIIYFHGAASRRKVPGMAWMRRCYRLIDRRLRKNLKGLYIVHPTVWLKTVIGFTKPFISSKFSSKLKFVNQLTDLNEMVPMEYVYIPDEVKKVDKQYTRS